MSVCRQIILNSWLPELRDGLAHRNSGNSGDAIHKPDYMAGKFTV